MIDFKLIAEEYFSGKTLKALHLQYGISLYILKREISKYGKLRVKHKKLVTDLEAIKTLYLQGYTTEYLGKQFKLNAATVRAYLESLGVERRNPAFTRKYNINDDYFEIIDTKDKAYWLGWLFSDGYINKNKIVLCLKHGDEYILHLFAKYLGADNYNVIFEPKTNSNRILFSSAKMVSDLAKHGVVERKSLILQPYLPDNKKFINHFIRGVFDGDGSIGFIKGKKSHHNKSLRFRICGGSYPFLECIRDYLVSELNIPQNKISSRKNGRLFNIEYGGNAICKTIYDWLYKDYDDLFLIRKKSIYDEFINNFTSFYCNGYASVKQIKTKRIEIYNNFKDKDKKIILDKLQELDLSVNRLALRTWLNKYLKTV